jgi:hypothetical protein
VTDFKETDMKRRTVLLSLVTILVAGLSSVVVPGGGQTSIQAAAGADPVLMTIPKSGQVLRSTSTIAIFWGPDWNDAGFAGDIISGLDTFFAGFGGSPFAGLATEYYDRTGPITNHSTYFGHVIDSSQPPAGALSASQVVGEACRIAGNNPKPDGIYFVYTSTAATLPGTCAQEIYGLCAKRYPIQVAYMPYTTGEPGSWCNGAGDSSADTGHSVVLSAYANATANKLMNTITNPRGTGWTDAYGKGMSFKCDGIFPPAGVFEQFSNGSIWRLRAKWSNAAYLAGAGLPNASGQPGCVY